MEDDMGYERSPSHCLLSYEDLADSDHTAVEPTAPPSRSLSEHRAQEVLIAPLPSSSSNGKDLADHATVEPTATPSRSPSEPRAHPNLNNDSASRAPSCEEHPAPDVAHASSHEEHHHAPDAARAPPSIPIDMPPPARNLLDDSSDVWYWRALMLLCIWLHLHYHTPYRACTLILQVIRFIFVTLGLLTSDSDALVTLHTAMQRLQLRDNFEVKAMCIACSRLYDNNPEGNPLCSTCKTPLFKSTVVSKQPEAAQNAVPPSDNPTKVPSRANAKTAVPQLQTPYSILSTQLPDYDGNLWKTLPGPDGKLFFDNRPDREDPSELRIGVTLGFDGYQSRNLILCGLTPGPKELTADELQHFMKEYITDLLQLYNEGIILKTPLFPQGRRVRVILLAVCCDHPALCRMAGFGDHNTKEGFCSRCKIKHADLKTEADMTIGAFPLRNGDKHQRLGQEYLQQADTQARESFFKQHSTWYTELSRLPYFDAVRMTVIDPMYNILLGIVKTQWLDAWIHENAFRGRTSKVPRELDQIHEYLKTFEMPRWVARLPKDVGYPAGGSLTADEWKGMALNYCPAIVPLIWDEWQPLAEEAHKKKMKTWQKKEKARLRRIAMGKRRADDGDEPAAPKPKPRMHAQDADNFLSLASALKIILARSIDRADLPHARQLLQDYLLGFLKIHPTHVKPNFHFVTHIFEQIEDYGPVYGFWTFLTERLNKVLKSYATNNHNGGELEVTFFRAFSREVQLRCLLNELASFDVSADLTDQSNTTSGDQTAAQIARLLLKTDSDQRGTVAALAHPIAELEHDLSSRFSLDAGALHSLARERQHDLLVFYTCKYPLAPIVDITASTRPPNAHFLNVNIHVHNYVVLDGWCIFPSRGAGKYAPDSIIQANFANMRYVGEIFQILTYVQPGTPGGPNHILYVRWFSRLTDVDTSIWDPYPELEIGFWLHKSYLNPSQSGPPAFIPISDVVSQACRIGIKLNSVRRNDADSDIEDDIPEASVPLRTVWMTTGLSRDVCVV
ncbi:hypothetical protein B0H21DRAFT_827671 [Amylocystis lapponica]|nr:hypothetical protein B0H21DRAFT_827671 [Amylocystis lapponica]